LQVIDSSAIRVSVSPSRPRLAASLVIRIVNALLSFIGAMNSATASSSLSAGAETFASPQSAHWLPDSSWGGYVIAGAAPRLVSRLKALVFWSAFVPEAGRSLYDEVPPSYQELFAQLAGASADNTVALPPEVFQGAFMGDADPAAAAVVHSVLRPQPIRTFTDPPADEAYRGLGIPMHYVLSDGDVALPPGEYGWDRFAERIKAAPVSVPGSHESMFTRPAELADALIQLASAP